MDPDLVGRLSSGEGWGLLQSLPPYEESAALALGDSLRAAGFDSTLVAGALTQSRLRARAVAKFGAQAREMLFTPDGLEQATRQVVAHHHAQRYAGAGVQRVYDLGCGIGADAMAFAAADLEVHAVDADETTARIAAVNLRRWSGARVQSARAEQTTLPTGTAARHSAVWLDPARRTPGIADITGRTRRTFSLEQLSPSWTSVQALAAALPAAGAKLSPSFPHQHIPLDAEAAWTSVDGEVVECTLWWGDLVRHRGRTAQVLGPRVEALITEEMARGAPAPSTSAPVALTDSSGAGCFLYEPDRAVIRAGLTGALVNAVQGRELAPGVGYVLSPAEHHLPWARRYRIHQVLSLNPKPLRAALRDADIGRLTIKKRGVSLDPEQWRRSLRLSGSREATVVLTRAGSAQVAILVEAS